MDADCLIKLTKSGLKEPICRFAEVVIPRTVQREVVEAGRIKGQPDADLVDQNIRDGLIAIAEESSPHHSTGDQALIDVFKEGRYTVIATDDAKLIRNLRSAGSHSRSPPCSFTPSTKKAGLTERRRCCGSMRSRYSSAMRSTALPNFCWRKGHERQIDKDP